jgi:hypothetical protein
MIINSPTDGHRIRVLSENVLDPNYKKNKDPPMERDRLGDSKFDKKCPPDAELKEFITLLTVRLNHDFGAPNQLLWPGRTEDIHKTTLLDLTWDIAMDLIPPEIVPPEFLSIMREFFVYHMSIYWKKENSTEMPHTAQDMYSYLSQELIGCRHKLQGIHEAIQKVQAHSVSCSSIIAIQFTFQ